MTKRDKNIIAKRLVHSYLSSIISIALVLLLIGLFALLAVNAQQVSNYFKENVKISAIFKENITEERAKIIQQKLNILDGVKESYFISKEEGTREMVELLGEDFLKVFDNNPIPISVELKLRGEYVVADSIERVKQKILEFNEIEELSYQHSIIEVLNNNIEKIGLVLMIFALLLMFISFVLINNTVRLNIYSKRFSIYTMRLVGATKSFIRSPFLIKSMFQGVIAGLLASVALLGVLYYVRNEFEQLFAIFNLQLMGVVLIGVVILGGLICLICTFFVVNKLVRINNDDLYY